MDWREAEKVVVDKFEDLQTKLELYTPEDIYGDYDEVSPHLHSDDNRLRYITEVIVEFRKNFGAIKNAYCGI